MMEDQGFFIHLGAFLDRKYNLRDNDFNIVTLSPASMLQKKVILPLGRFPKDTLKLLRSHEEPDINDVFGQDVVDLEDLIFRDQTSGEKVRIWVGYSPLAHTVVLRFVPMEQKSGG